MLPPSAGAPAVAAGWPTAPAAVVVVAVTPAAAVDATEDAWPRDSAAARPEDMPLSTERGMSSAAARWSRRSVGVLGLPKAGAPELRNAATRLSSSFTTGTAAKAEAP